MGALDDAIREHLELKRKRGEDPDTLAEKEAEAFGPVRREPLPAEPAAEEAAPLAPDSEIFEPEVEADLDPVPDFDADPEPVAAVPEPEPEPEAWEPEPEPTAILEPEPEPEPAPPLPEPAPPMPEPAAAAPPPAPVAPAPEPEPDEAWEAEPPVRRGDTPPQGTPVVEEPADGEDVLEETPDFLQDTPEHDRLWFEQKPPRDFDFDA